MNDARAKKVIKVRVEDLEPGDVFLKVNRSWNHWMKVMEKPEPMRGDLGRVRVKCEHANSFGMYALELVDVQVPANAFANPKDATDKSDLPVLVNNTVSPVLRPERSR